MARITVEDDFEASEFYGTSKNVDWRDVNQIEAP